jgi:Mg2+/Co2+ transporter CorB
MSIFGISIVDSLSMILGFACLFFAFFFSLSETSLTASSRVRMLTLEKNGDKNAKKVNELLEKRERLIGGILIGNNLANTAYTTLTASAFIAIFGNEGIAYATLFVSVIIIVFLEVLPKTIAINYPDRVALFIARPLSIFVAILGPLTLVIEKIVRVFIRLLGFKVGENQNVLSGAEELRGTVNLMHEEGSVEKSDRDMVGGILDLKDLAVSDVMVHRTKMVVINVKEPPEDIVKQVLASSYTRLPAYEGETENIIGILHSKDLVRALSAADGDAKKLDIASLLLPPWFIPDSTSLQDQLKAFLRRKMHFALVVDEYGEVQGHVTLEDIIEEIVGDIKDEHDVMMQGVRPQPDGSFNVEGSVPIRDLNRALDWELPDDEATTVAGLVIHEAKMIPDSGQTFTFHGYVFHVLRRNRNRITAIKIIPQKKIKSKKQEVV